MITSGWIKLVPVVPAKDGFIISMLEKADEIWEGDESAYPIVEGKLELEAARWAGYTKASVGIRDSGDRVVWFK
jgi:hypothetical protein